jgi:hypothetical protein
MRHLGAGDLTSVAVEKPTAVIPEEKPAEAAPSTLERSSVESPETPRSRQRYGLEAIPEEYRNVF